MTSKPIYEPTELVPKVFQLEDGSLLIIGKRPCPGALAALGQLANADEAIVEIAPDLVWQALSRRECGA